MTPYYDDGQVTIYCGDALEVLPTLDFAVIVTDPPYGIGWKRGVNYRRGSKPHTGIAGDGDTVARDAVLSMAQETPAVVFGSFYAPFPANLRQVLVWEKPPDAGVVGSTTGYRRDAEPIFLVGPWPRRTVTWGSVLRSTRRSIAAVTRETGHPHTKPLDLMRALVASCPPGSVLDPFMGSGSTVLAARECDRRAIGIELDERYCEIAVARLAQGALNLGGAA